MADYTYHRIVKVRHEWRIPGASFGGPGVAVVELYQAMSAAEARYEQMLGKPPTFDDWLRVIAADDEIVLFFDHDESVLFFDHDEEG